MNISSTNNAFVIPPHRNEIASDPVRKQPADLSSEEQIPRADEAEGDNGRVFTLTPERSESINQFQNRSSLDSGSNNPSISQYLQTESLAKRDELESLVGLDLFV